MADSVVLIFYKLAILLPGVSVIESGVLTYPTIIIFLFISSFKSVSFCFLYFQALVLGMFMYKLLQFLIN